LDNTDTPLPPNINIHLLPHENIVPPHNIITNFLSSNNDTLYINTNIFYNKQYVTDDIKNYINSKIKFKQIYYDKACQLCLLKNYNVLHIRCSDNHFTTNCYSPKILNEIKKLELNENTIIISNNSHIKKQIHEKFGFYFIDLDARHTAHSTNYSELESTIIEYIILSKSSNIVCFSYYPHGSGFSEQCAVLNNIPYTVYCGNGLY
jgi:bifunctional pyridoxal-dependent enzyme with beta-cystathionase and maltose regulon repressor activities